MRVPILLTLISASMAASQFTLSAFAPGTPYENQVINAAGQAFYLGLAAPASYCPAQVALCPAGNETVFAGLLGLMVEVPGGQQIYVSLNGALGFTAPHSASTPLGSFIGGFKNVTVVSSCGDYVTTVVSWGAPDGSTQGILACPVANATTAQIFAKTPKFNRTDCTELIGLLPEERPEGTIGAWEYT